MRVNGDSNSVLAARLREPFFAGTSAHEAIDGVGFALARRQWERDPKKYEDIARDLFDLSSPTTVAKNHKVGVETVRQIRALYPELIAAGKLRLLANLEEASLLFSGRLLEEKLAIERVPAALSTVVEKLSLLSGGATIRTEHVSQGKQVASPEQLKEMFAKLAKATTDQNHVICKE